jgi:superoxide dismutase, Cu-Zn family
LLDDGRSCEYTVSDVRATAVVETLFLKGLSMKKLVMALVAVSAAFFYLEAQEPAKSMAPQRATAVLHPSAKSMVHGLVVFTQKDGYVEITGEVKGLTPGKHGFHIHEFGDCSESDFMCAGGHFNPTGKHHGGPEDADRHAGDLGNITADDSGKATINMKDRVLRLSGPTSIIGRGVIVHAKADDLRTQPSGDAGARVACGVIGIAKAEAHK